MPWGSCPCVRAWRCEGRPPLPHHFVCVEKSTLPLLEGADRELRKSGDATHLATDGPAPRRYDGDTAAARVRVAVFVRSESPTRSSVTVSSNLRRARRTSTAPSVDAAPCDRSLESSSSAAHTLCTVDTAYCAAATAVTAMGSPSLALSHLCCGLCERHCSATAGTL